jgi:drug/metabolite transporter (DMT)-like permease
MFINVFLVEIRGKNYKSPNQGHLMNWILYSLIAGSFSSFSALLSRRLMKERDPYAMSFVFSLMFIPFLIFVFRDFKLVLSILPWMFLGSISVMVGNIISFHSVKYYPPSFVNIWGKLTILWVAIGGFLFFNETFTIIKIIGMILIVLGSVSLIKFQKIEKVNWKIVNLIFMGFLFGVFTLANKQVLETLSPAATLFFGSTITAALHLFLPNIFSKTKKLILKMNWKFFIPFIIIILIHNLSRVSALKVESPALVYVTIQAFMSITLVGEFFLLKDRKGIWKRVMGFLLSTMGIILIAFL